MLNTALSQILLECTTYSPCSSLSSFSSVSCMAFSTRCWASACFCFLLSALATSPCDPSSFKAASPTSKKIFPMRSKACARCLSTFLDSCLSLNACRPCQIYIQTAQSASPALHCAWIAHLTAGLGDSALDVKSIGSPHGIKHEAQLLSLRLG